MMDDENNPAQCHPVIQKKTCKECGNVFECKEESTCWCYSEPRLKETEIKYDDCVCKDCLRIQYREKIVGK